MDSENRRRYVILSEGQFGEPGSKTAMGVIKYGSDPVVAVLDSTRAGRNVSEWLGAQHAAPVVATLAEALPYEPTDAHEQIQADKIVGTADDTNGALLYPDGAPRFRMIQTNGGSATRHGRTMGRSH